MRRLCIARKAELLKVFIHASYEKRAERIVTLYGESDTAIEKRIKEKDKRRSAYYKYYTEIEYGDARNYDVALDSGKLGIEKCVEIITDLYKINVKTTVIRSVFYRRVKVHGAEVSFCSVYNFCAVQASHFRRG